MVGRLNRRRQFLILRAATLILSTSSHVTQ